MRFFDFYLKLVNYTGYKTFSRVLLKNYAELYRTKRVISSLAIGYELGMLVMKNTISDCKDVINDHITSGIKNIHAETLSFQERIDAMKLISDLENNLHQKIDPEKLPKIIHWKSAPLGYTNGLARLLILNVNKKTELL